MYLLSVLFVTDLNIKIFNLFDSNPILWSLLELVAEVRPILCHVTKLVSALLHVLITLWESSRSANCALEQRWLDHSCRLLAVLHKAQFIPKQLSSLSEILPMVTPYEAMTILTFCWRYIQVTNVMISSFLMEYICWFPSQILSLIILQISYFPSISR